MRIVFLHPDLGIGGAERLVVDAALGLQQAGHDVVMYTSHHDPSHCFEETRDGTLRVVVHGDWLPRHVCGRLHIVFAILRSLWAACCLLLLGPRADVVFVDQLSISIPLLRWFSGSRVVFYCHFPDLLLAKHETWLQRLYRAPVDWLEELTTGMSDCVLVNSKFTATQYDRVFTRIAQTLRPRVLYPSINFAKYDPPEDAEPDDETRRLAKLRARPVMFLSINRFEKKKNIALAVKGMAAMLKDGALARPDDVQLIIAGGFDPRVSENRRVYEELTATAHEHGLSTSDFPDLNAQVVFLRSFSDQERSWLLEHCTAVIYTPENEHFGIVPIEAMYARRPVVAVNSGGPLETVRDGETGYLREPTTEAFAGAMTLLANDLDSARSMGQTGRAHVIESFSIQTFNSTLDAIVREPTPGRPRRTSLLWASLLVTVAVAVAVVRSLL